MPKYIICGYVKDQDWGNGPGRAIRRFYSCIVDAATETEAWDKADIPSYTSEGNAMRDNSEEVHVVKQVRETELTPILSKYVNDSGESRYLWYSADTGLFYTGWTNRGMMTLDWLKQDGYSWDGWHLSYEEAFKAFSS